MDDDSMIIPAVDRHGTAKCLITAFVRFLDKEAALARLLG